MSKVSYNCNVDKDVKLFEMVEQKFGIQLRDEIKNFIIENAGGYPRKNVIVVDTEEYEVRVFLSLDRNDAHYFIGEPLITFLNNTKGRIVPLAIDSEDNFYCINNETGKIYYWSSEMDEYTFLAESLDSFARLFE